MHVPSEIRTRIANDVVKYVAMATNYFGKQYSIPQINYNLRGRTAGQAERHHTVSFNPVLLMENVEDFIARTVPHEVAHCIDAANGRDDNVGIRFDRRGRPRREKRSVHGPEWQRIMRVFGVKDITRCHSYDVTNSVVKVKGKFEYRCTTCSKSFILTSVRHNKMRRGKVYFCTRCGPANGRLELVSNLGQRSYEEARALADQRKENVQRSRELLRETFGEKYQTKLGKSNMEIAKDVMAKYGRNLTRSQFIAYAVQAGLKQTTASTYFNQLRAA